VSESIWKFFGQFNSFRLSSKISRYTNTIITIVCATGLRKGIFPILFTHNPEFHKDRKKTKMAGSIRNEKLKYLEDRMKFYGIEDRQIIFVGEGKHFAGEKAEYGKKALSIWELEKNAIFLHDEGNSFKQGNDSVFANRPGDFEVSYPSAVHQFISPNDNNLHGVAKVKWRNAGLDFEDDINSTLNLMWQLEQVPGLSIREWWIRNFFVQSGWPTKEDYFRLIRSGTKEMSELHQLCKNLFDELYE
jgi:hypothetical protein